MPQKALPSTTLTAAVRGYLGLSQEQLAAYLGISRGQVAHVEAGRRPLRAGAARLLRELAAQLPPPLGSAAAVAATTDKRVPAPTTAKMLRRRLLTCCWHLANLRVELARLEERVELAHRWRSLRVVGPAPPVSSAAAVRRDQLLREWTTTAAEALGTDAAVERQLLALRIRLLEAECLALEEMLLGPGLL